MDSKIILESFLNAIDIGAVFESINKVITQVLAPNHTDNRRLYRRYPSVCDYI